jgi:peroxiredoxin
VLRIDDLLPLLAGLLLGLILVSVWAVLFLLYQIVKQQGRLLLRLDGVEEQLRSLAPVKPEVPAGLPVGEKFQPFQLADLDGNKVALEDFRGKRVLLVNWSPNCGFCVRIAEELGRLKQVFPAHNVELALASFGDAEANRKLAREHGLESSVLLRQDAPPIEAFENLGTPVAYLLNEEGQVAKPLMVGADRVPVLARYAVAEATEAELAAKSGKQRICGQAPGNAPKAQEIQGAGPGTELKKMLAKIGIAVTADCPCNERAAVMDSNGWAWCEHNLETIVGWMREESARRGTIFIEFGARFLVKRAIAKARRSDGELKNSTADSGTEPRTRRTA